MPAIDRRRRPAPGRRAARACAAGACAASLVVLGMVGCGRPSPTDRPIRPTEVRDFGTLFARNCSGCHGAEGRLGPAPPLNDPLFLAIMPDDQLRRVVAQGRPGTLMPAFATARGGTLTDEQVALVAEGIRRAWSSTTVAATAGLPKYLAGAPPGGANSPANRELGLKVFALVCGNCHGAGGEGGEQAGPLRDATFLSMISDQALRRIIITGRPDLGMPDYRGLGAMLPEGQPLTDQQIADVVALLARWREEGPAPAAHAAQ